MPSLPSFVWLDGYGGYVWGSVLMCALVVTLEVAWLRHRRRVALTAVHDGDDTVTAPAVRQPVVTAAHGASRAPHMGDAA